MTPTAPSPVSGALAARFQFFLSFAVLGSIVPFIPVLLAQRGLSNAQIGNVWAIASLGVIFTPLLVTFLADTHIPPRFLMAALFALAGLFLAALLPATAYWPILALYALHAFALQPIFPLQDGIHFAAQSARRALALPEVPYHQVRFMGTIGYLIPAVALYFVLSASGTLNAVLVCGIAFAALGALNAFRLPAPPPAAAAPPDAHANLPTGAALRAILEPHVLTFCLAMFLIHMASQAYYQFYPIHLTDRARVDARYVGLIADVGVVAEMPFMLLFAAIVRRLTLRRVMYLGALAAAARLFLLAIFDGPAVAIATQLIHGPTVLLVHVAPPIFLNARADDRYRNSIQGLYTMAFAGAGKVVGSWASGAIAQHSLPLTFAIAGTICIIATALFFFAFRGPAHDVSANPLPPVG